MKTHNASSQRCYYKLGGDRRVYVTGQERAVKEGLKALRRSRHKAGVVVSTEDGAVVAQLIKEGRRACLLLDLSLGEEGG